MSTKNAKFGYTLTSMGVLLILDGGDHSKQLTVTNDIENVLAQIFKSEVKPTQVLEVFYKDSDSQWDKVEIDEDGKFVEFKFTNPLKAKTIQKIAARPNDWKYSA